VVVADNEVTTAKILDANVTNAKLASDIDASKLTTGTLPIARIADGAVTAAKLDGAQTGSAPIYGCRAWVNFDGTTVTDVGGENRCTIRASGNVTKVVRNNTGDYTITFTTAMPDANYATVINTNQSSSNPSLVNISRLADELSAPTASAVRITQGVPEVARTLQRENASFINVAIFR
jgi:hypothetical protein